MNKNKFIIASILFVGLSTVGFAQSDADINAAVSSKLAADQSLQGTNIHVTATNGTVNLTGKVNSDTQLNTATELAQSVDGVKDVHTKNLTVKGSTHPLGDTLITAKIKGLFIQQKLFGDKDVAAMSISVETNNGVVSLSGTADNQAQIDNAIRLAKSVNGVKRVTSSIKLNTSTT